MRLVTTDWSTEAFTREYFSSQQIRRTTRRISNSLNITSEILFVVNNHSFNICILNIFMCQALKHTGSEHLATTNTNSASNTHANIKLE